MIPLEEALAAFPVAQSYRPGDSSALNAEIIGLIRSGAKTVSCEAWSVFDHGLESFPEAGRVDIVLNWDGTAACATETVKVDKVRFCDVTAEMVPPQGEFKDLEHWRAGYESYLTRTGRFHQNAPMMVETFRLVRDFGDHKDV
ncbi:ASCH domain-containing protein [Pseudophaeobacter sp. C1-32P7]|uniref:ASCH domain-containing protein n=1 Tax=Pseudophaeobacter sp. C1-32P7 TaxID=3098142 RepID=UPI0034D75919